VLVLMNGRPLSIAWERTGRRDPGNLVRRHRRRQRHRRRAVRRLQPVGQAAITFPRSVGQIPTYYNHLRIGRPFTPGKPGNYTSQYFEDPTARCTRSATA
jgi:beta-glucosidase